MTLIERATAGTHTPIGLLLNGLAVFGEIHPDQAFADRLDAQALDLFNRATWSNQPDQDELERLRGVIGSMFRDQADKDKAETDEVSARLTDVELENIDAEDERALKRIYTPTFFTLSTVTIMTNGGAVSIPDMRVATAHIQAWWPAVLSETGWVASWKGPR